VAVRFHGDHGLFGRFVSGAPRQYRSVSAMPSSNSMKREIALAACLAALLVVTSAPVRAAESLPDAGILSAAPFTFKSDGAIFSKQHNAPDDSRIFSPRKSLSGNREPQLSDDRFAHPTLL
jgi:hypothetical protein